MVDPDVVGIRVLYSWDDGPWFESPMNGSLWQMTESLATFPIYNLQHKLQVREYFSRMKRPSDLHELEPTTMLTIAGDQL